MKILLKEAKVNCCLRTSVGLLGKRVENKQFFKSLRARGTKKAGRIWWLETTP